jgi:hypothetical protein
LRLYRDFKVRRIVDELRQSVQDNRVIIDHHDAKLHIHSFSDAGAILVVAYAALNDAALNDAALNDALFTAAC